MATTAVWPGSDRQTGANTRLAHRAALTTRLAHRAALTTSLLTLASRTNHRVPNSPILVVTVSPHTPPRSPGRRRRGPPVLEGHVRDGLAEGPAVAARVL